MIWHNASGDNVKLAFFVSHDPGGVHGERKVFECEVGGEVDIPDVFVDLVPLRAPQLKKGPAPEAAEAQRAVPPPPKDPKKQAQAGK